MSPASLVADRRPLPLDVVSIQSQVIYGRVGNNAAVPTLEALGLSVAAVPTVMLSNIPSYPSVHGGAVPDEWFSGYLQDLEARGALDALRAVQVGYLGNRQQAVVLERWISGLLEQNPQLHIVIDPVIGDEEHGVYGALGVIEVYAKFVALANGLTPNGFELGCLTGMPVHDVDSVIAAARSLLSSRTQWVAVTSAAPGSWPIGQMGVVLVTATHTQVVRHPRVSAAFAGTGDLFTAALTGHWLQGCTLQEAALNACDYVVSTLRRTEQHHSRELLLPRERVDPDRASLDIQSALRRKHAAYLA